MTCNRFPRQLAGRTLCSVGSGYLLYARSPGDGNELARCVHRDIEAFRSRYATTAAPAGIVLAIDSDDEPCDALELWWKRQGTRLGSSLFPTPYARGPSAIPYQECVRMGIIPSLTCPPYWVCALPTKAYLKRAFAERLREHKARVEEEVSGTPVVVRLIQPWAVPLYALVAEAMYARCLAIDLEVLGIQNQATLWAAILGEAIQDGPAREASLATVRVEAERARKRLMACAPLD